MPPGLGGRGPVPWSYAPSGRSIPNIVTVFTAACVSGWSAPSTKSLESDSISFCTYLWGQRRSTADKILSRGAARSGGGNNELDVDCQAFGCRRSRH